MRIVVALFFLLLQSAQQPVFRTNINFVELDVSVLDKDRRPVLDLTAADFTVLEDGVPQKVESFSAVVLPEPEPPPTTWWTSVAEDVERNVDAGDGVATILILAVREASLIYRTKQIARSLVERMGLRDRMAVAHTGFSGNSQDFTADKAALLASVDRFMPSPDIGAPCRLEGLLGDVARLMGPLAGRRKAAFLLLEGFSAPEPGTPCFNEILELYREAQRAHLNIYPINVRGLVGFGDVTVESAGGMDAAMMGLRMSGAGERTLAENTGGVAITQTNMFQQNIERVYVENRAYYILGYHSTNASTERELRQLKVSVARDGVTVRSRNAYSAGRSRAAEVVTDAPSIPADLAGAARAPIPATALRLDATALAFRGAKGAAVAVVASAQPRLEPGASGIKEEVQARAMLVDRFGDIKQTVERRVGGVVSAAGERSELRVPMILQSQKPGRYQVRVAANSAVSNATGSVFVNVDVPDFRRERLSLSGVAMRVAPDSPGMTLPGLDEAFPFLPSTRRTFRSSDDVEAAVRVYSNRPEGPATVVCRIKDAAESVVSVLEREATARETATSAGALVRCPIDIAALRAGHHLFELEARVGSRTATRAVKFVIE